MIRHEPADALAEFIQKFEGSLDPRLWVKLVKEETKEMAEAHWEWLNHHETYGEDEATLELKAALLKEAADVMYTATAFHLLMETSENLYRFLVSTDEWTDWELTMIEANNAMKMASAIFGANLLADAFYRVHQSNLSKLGDDGKPVRRDDGKILKGPNYEPPYLLDLVTQNEAA